ncbi:CD209 antigen-like protein [Labeo rohita]|uniref:CD209 antigen-like protein n=1 Tax=Labeo rohita TaxID=84645 RepID=A0A498LNG7_LABRO|nr:CD209 antigen-like protein [Labeo rohita]
MDSRDGEELKSGINGDTTKSRDVRTRTEKQTPGNTGSDYVKTRSSRAAVACLVLLCVLLLTAVIVLCVQVFTNIDLFQLKSKNIMEERLQLLTKISNVSEKREWLLNKNINVTNERDELISKNTNLTKQRDQFKQERDELLKTFKETDGWLYFSFSFYFFSSEKKSWTESRRYCTERGADLIIINNTEEQDFVRKIANNAYVWIGLTDTDVEGTWKWVDGSTLTSGFWDPREPNGKKGENCALSYSPGWADFSFGNNELMAELVVFTDGWLYSSFSFYFISSLKNSWTESRRYCTERGADLIIINNREEQEFAKKFSHGNPFWIGLTDSDVEDSWKWADGSTLTSGFWGSGEPNGREIENCVVSYSSGWCDYPYGWLYSSFSFYFISSLKNSWTESRRYCTGRGTDLIIINNREEQEFAKKFSHGNPFWIGLTDSDVEDSWKWVDGSTLTSRSESEGMNRERLEMTVDIYESADCVRDHDLVTETNTHQPPQQTGSDSAKTRSSRAAVVCLVLLCVLLLTAVIVLCVHIHTNNTNYTEETHQLLAKITNLTEKRDQLLTKNTNLTKERDELLTKNTNLTNERDELLTKNDNLTKQSKQFIQERNELVTSLHKIVIVLCVHIHTNNTNYTQETHQLLTKITNLTKKGEELLTKNINLTDERDGLLTKNDNLTKQREQFIQKRNELVKSLHETDGWNCYENSLYYVSTAQKNWTESKRDCTERGADLIILNDKQEEDFVNKLSCGTNVWIGLTDREVEGTWKWVDGSTPTSSRLNTSYNGNMKNPRTHGMDKDEEEMNTNADAHDAINNHDVWTETENSNTKRWQTPQYTDGWLYYRSHFYYISSQKKNWYDSRRYCTDRRADLIIINNRDEHNFFKKMSCGAHAWIGLTDRHAEGRWKWVDGSNPGMLNTVFDKTVGRHETPTA